MLALKVRFVPLEHSYYLTFVTILLNINVKVNFFQNRYFNDTALRVSTLMWDLGNKMQLCIQGYNKRPYGVGLLVAGYDDLGPHIYQVNHMHLFCKLSDCCL